MNSGALGSPSGSSTIIFAHQPGLAGTAVNFGWFAGMPHQYMLCAKHPAHVCRESRARKFKLKHYPGLGGLDSTLPRMLKGFIPGRSRPARFNSLFMILRATPDSGRRETAVLQQWSDIGLPVEIAKENLGLLRSSTRQHLGAKHVAVGTRQAAMAVEPLTRIAGQHLAP